jgi:probable phosphoglycerate mutase
MPFCGNRSAGDNPVPRRAPAKDSAAPGERDTMAPVLTLHLVRHGETLHAAPGCFAGDIDPPITDKGRAEAEAVARVAAGLGLEALYVSPKLRARMTAEPIERASRLAPVIEDGLREIAYGSWEGRKETEVEASEPEAFELWSRDPALFSPPGGESAFAVAARALPVLARARREHASGHVMLVSHKATIRILVCALLDVPIARFRDRFACPPASLTSFQLGERGALLVRLGEVFT